MQQGTDGQESSASGFVPAKRSSPFSAPRHASARQNSLGNLDSAKASAGERSPRNPRWEDGADCRLRPQRTAPRAAGLFLLTSCSPPLPSPHHSHRSRSASRRPNARRAAPPVAAPSRAAHGELDNGMRMSATHGARAPAESRGRVFLKLLLLSVIIQYSYGANFDIKRWKRQSCSSRQFQCNSGQCVDQFVICDGEKNCDDGSDETSRACQNIGCPSYAYRCAYGACVNSGARCNNKQECADGSDEAGCGGSTSNSKVVCKNNQFLCKSGTCVDVFLLCDGTKDCDDGSDETQEECGTFQCPSYAFRCDYGACIDRTGLCNGVPQCADGSDEKPERCGPKPTPKPTPAPTPPPTGGCKLPPQPENGQYKLGGCSPPCQPVPGQTVDTAFLTYSCSSGFVLSGAPVLLCEGKWSAEFPTCARARCSALINPSREIECKRNEKKVDCDQPMPPGTKAMVKCGTFYTNVKEFSDFDLTCQSDGTWSRQVSSCIPSTPERYLFIFLRYLLWWV